MSKTDHVTLTDLLLITTRDRNARHVLVTAAPDGATVLHLSRLDEAKPMCDALDGGTHGGLFHRLVGGICDAQALLLSVFMGDVPCDDCARIIERQRERSAEHTRYVAASVAERDTEVKS